DAGCSAPPTRAARCASTTACLGRRAPSSRPRCRGREPALPFRPAARPCMVCAREFERLPGFDTGRTAMQYPSLFCAFAQTVVLLTTIGAAQAHDESKYPNLKGQWDRFIVRGLPGQASFDQTKGWGEYQEAPLTPEYQKIFDENVKDQEAGGLGAGADHAR